MWTDQARCKGIDTNLFFPVRGSFSKEVLEEIQVYCSNCPVTEECLNYAIDNNIQSGVWGGFSTKQRRLIRVKRRRQYKSVA